MYVYIYIYLYIHIYIESGLAVSFLQLCFCSIASVLAHDIWHKDTKLLIHNTNDCNRLQQAATGSDTLMTMLAAACQRVQDKTISATTSSL